MTDPLLYDQGREKKRWRKKKKKKGRKKEGESYDLTPSDSEKVKEEGQSLLLTGKKSRGGRGG